MKTTRFPNGVTNCNKNGGVLWNFGALDPTVYHQYMEDFDYYVAANYTITTVTSGSPTQALTNGNGGLLLITNTAGATDSTFLDKKGESFAITAGKQAFFKARFQVSDANLSAFVMGLQITDTTPLAVTDGIFFQKAASSTHLDFYCQKDATTGKKTTLDIAEVVSATNLSVGWYYDGGTVLNAYVNEVLAASFDPTGFLPDSTLTVSFGIQNGEAVAKTMTVDYTFAAFQR